MADKVRKMVEKLLERRGEGGVGGVHAWFSGMPHISAQQQAGRYKVLMWREGVALEFDVDEEGNVRDVYVKTAF